MNRLNKLALTATLSLFTTFSATAGEISTNTAVMQAMDKITGQVDLIEVPVNQEVGFGTFSIVVRECKTRTPEETPENFAFVDVVDRTTDRGNINIFKGWMISSSPALNPVAHPIYDVWLIKCVDRKTDIKKRMSAEQLAARDEIEMNRQIAPQNKNLIEPIEQSSTIDNDGEPTALIPDNIEQTTGNEDEPLLPAINNITPQIDSNYEIPEEGEPEALINISDEPQNISPATSTPEYETIENIPVVVDSPKPDAEQQVPDTEDIISKLESELSAKVNN